MRGRATVLATIVLVVVLGGLMAGVLFAVGGLTARTRDVASAVEALSAYQVVHRAIANEAFAEAGYWRDPSADARKELDVRIFELNDSVSAVRGLNILRDSGSADFLLILNARYEMALRASLEEGGSAQIYDVGPALDKMQSHVDRVVDRRQTIADRAAAAELGLERELLVLAPAALVVAIVAISLCWGVILGQHRQLRERAEAGERKALHDVLTGVGNRAMLTQQLLVELDGPRPDLALLMVDLDHFKLVNDVHGHAAGDEVLREAAKRLGEASGSQDVVCRLGGDEFVVLVHPASAADEVTAGIESAVREPIFSEGEELHIHASVGCAVARPGMDERAILTQADEALYSAKRAAQARIMLASAAKSRVHVKDPVPPSP